MLYRAGKYIDYSDSCNNKINQNICLKINVLFEAYDIYN